MYVWFQILVVTPDLPLVAGAPRNQFLFAWVADLDRMAFPRLIAVATRGDSLADKAKCPRRCVGIDYRLILQCSFAVDKPQTLGVNSGHEKPTERIAESR